MDGDGSKRYLLECMLNDPQAKATDLPLSLLEAITNNFCEEHKIGKGGFAVVYRGVLRNGIVAVKKLAEREYTVDEKYFIGEAENLMNVQHKNIVRLLGYCNNVVKKFLEHDGKRVVVEDQQRLLCFEFLPKGSLRDYITSPDDEKGLEWETRYQIVKGICEGLHHLHSNNILHLDLKPENILLNDKMEPKIADFGLSKLFDEEKIRTTTLVTGSAGYMAPERCRSTKQLTFKLDIYSLGVIILEILTGERGHTPVDDVLESWKTRFKPSQGNTWLEQIEICAKIGIECIESDPRKRPVVWHIIETLQKTERSSSTIHQEKTGSPKGTPKVSGHTSSTSSTFQDLDANCNDTNLQLKYMTWQLQAALANLPDTCFRISDEVQEEVDLVRAQLRREMENKGALDVTVFTKVHDILVHIENVGPQSQQPHQQPEQSQMDKISQDHLELQNAILLVSEIIELSNCGMTKITSELNEGLENIGTPDSPKPAIVDCQSSVETKSSFEVVKKPDSVAIPEGFRCPISHELMRDPVIVSTGQTYERALIQMWIDRGNITCPITRQKLQNLTLTPNYVLRSLIMQWCEEKGVEPPSRSETDGSSPEVGGNRLAIEALVRNLSSSSLDEQKSAAAEIRSLAKKNTDNRILLAESSAIPALVKLLSSKDPKAQEHAVIALLNLSIYDQNKELIVVAGAIVPIIQVLRMGSMEARENAAAAIFSLSLIDNNKIIIGSTPGAIEALVELLQSGSSRGKKNAATALFNLCIYQANKVRAVREGILVPLIRMLQDSSGNGAVDEALTILSVLVSHHECKTAISKAHAIPFLVDLLRSGQARNKENAAAILLGLCKKDAENLACVGRLDAQIPLTDLAKTGTERAKRKATSLLEHLSKLQGL